MIILQTKNPEFLKHSPSVILMCNSSVSFNYVLDMFRYKLKNISPPECMGVKNFKKEEHLKYYCIIVKLNLLVLEI